jgi:hypothetical protein
MSDSSDKESIQEEHSVNGDEDLRAERDSHKAAAAIGTGGSGVPQYSNNADAAIGTGRSGMPPDGAIQRAQQLVSGTVWILSSFPYTWPLAAQNKTHSLFPHCGRFCSNIRGQATCRPLTE